MLENALSGGRAPTHDPVGWPTFKDWPHHDSLTHEQSYYRWLERAWRAGQRIFVNLLVENKVLCELYPYKQNSCDEMDSVRLQARRIRELEDYIDAQSGGPGKGFFRIVTDPFQARRVINAGKLAVVLGIEVSEPFGCQVYNDEPQCDAARIDRELDEVYRVGVRDMEIINKFDNALGGVAGDSGATGAVVNSGNSSSTGSYWQMQPCDGPARRDRQAATGAVRPQPQRPHLQRVRAAPPAGRRAGLPGGRAMQREGADDARRAPDPAHDRQADDRRPRPPERARAQAGDAAARGPALLGRRLQPQLEHAGRRPADLQPRRGDHPVRRRPRLREGVARDRPKRTAEVLLRLRLRRGHERVRGPGRAARGARTRSSTRSSPSTAR